MHSKQGLLALVLILTSVTVSSQISYNPVSVDAAIHSFPSDKIVTIIDSPGHPDAEADPAGDQETRIADSAVAYKITSPGDSVRVSKQVFDEYNSDGMLERSSVYSWEEDDNQWQNKGKDDRYYYMSGKLKECLYYEWVEDIEHFTLAEKEKFKYKGDHIAQYLFESYNPNTIQKKSAHIEKYDDLGRLVYLKTQVRMDGHDWIDLKFIEIEYDEPGDRIKIFARKLMELDYRPVYATFDKEYTYQEGQAQIQQVILDVSDYPVTKADFFYDESGQMSHVVVSYQANLEQKDGNTFSVTLKKNYYYMEEERFVAAASIEALNRISHKEMITESQSGESDTRYKTYYYYNEEPVLADRPGRHRRQATAYSDQGL